MLGRFLRSHGRGGGNLPFGSILPRQGYWKRTEEEVHKTIAHVFGLPTEASTKNLVKYKQQRATNITGGKERGASAQQLNSWGSFVPPTDNWPLDNNFRI